MRSGKPIWCFLLLYGTGFLWPFFLSNTPAHAGSREQLQKLSPAKRDIQPNVNLTSLNIRLSNRAVHPPPHLIQESLLLPRIRAASSKVGPSPLSAILEDDQRNRVAVLTKGEDSSLTVHLLHDLNFESKIPQIVHCATQRQCALDRSPITGGLGCVAICLQEAIDPGPQP